LARRILFRRLVGSALGGLRDAQGRQLDYDDEDRELDAQALVMQLAAVNESRRPMVDAKPRAAVPGAAACCHHLMGTCHKGKDCSFSHEKAEGMALIRLLEKNLHKAETTTLASLVWEKGASARMRLRAEVNGFAAIAMVDPGSEKFDFVSRDFLKKHQIPTYIAEEPIQVDLAGTGNKYLLSKWAKLTFRAKSPITGAMVAYDSHAFVLPMSRDDLIIGMDNIVQHMQVLLRCSLAFFHSST